MPRKQALRYPNCYFDISIDGEPVGRIVFKLFDKTTPKTAINFRELCKGNNGHCYAGSTFHRIVPKFVCQGGDIIYGDGSGGLSIYGYYFDDENFEEKLNRHGLLAMANNGRNKNSSQFFITTVPTPWLNGSSVVFGEVESGYDVVKKIESVGTFDGLGTPKAVVKIEQSGVMELGPPS